MTRNFTEQSSEGFSSSRFFSERPVSSTIDGDRLRIDLDAIRRKQVAAHAAVREDDDFFVRMIERIRALIAKIFRAVFGSRPGASGAGNDMPGHHERTDAMSGLERDDDQEMVTKPLPPSILDRMRQSVDELVDYSLGANLAPSLRTALSMPDIDRKAAFRALLQSNLADTQTCRSACDELRGAAHAYLAPFAEQHDMSPEVALRILRADLDAIRDGRGGGALSDQMDPRSEVRGYIAEITRLETSLGARARARALICESAIKCGAYSQQELNELLAQHGLDPLADKPSEPEVSTEINPENESRSGDNVVSMATYRESALKQTEASAAAGETNKGTKTPERHSEAVRSGVRALVDEGVLPPSQTAIETIERQVAAADVLAEEESFETELSGDDFSNFKTKPQNMQPGPKP